MGLFSVLANGLASCPRSTKQDANKNMDEVGNLYHELFYSVNGHLQARNAKYIAKMKEEFEFAIVQLSEELKTFRGSMYDFRAILDPSSYRAERFSTRLAWLCQRAFDARAVSVNEKPLRSTQKGISFPLLEQAEMLAYRPAFPSTATRYRQLASMAKSKLHVMLHNRSRNEFTVIQGVPFSLACKISGGKPNLRANAPLFSNQRVYDQLYAPSRDIYSLLMARDMLQSSVEDCKVRAFLVLLDDERLDKASGMYLPSSSFQSHDLTNARYPASGLASVSLDTYPVGPSNVDFRTQFESDPSFFYRLPTCDWQWLQLAPATRPTRCMMMLDSIVTSQSNSDELLSFSPQHLRSRVEDEYGLYYPVDLHRHDVAAGLVTHGLIKKIESYGSTRYVVGTAGIALIHNVRRKFQISNKTSTNEIMTEVLKHEEHFLNAI